MKLKKKAGFTLIELLVVVLIIGVLTAVAVPQYRKAVLKSRFSTLMPLAKNLWDSNEVFYLNNGGYAAGVDELDVSAPADPNVQVEVMDEENHQYVRVSNPNIPNRITMYQKHSPNFPEETHCEALLNDDLANWLCQDSLQGTFVGNKFGYAVYSLSSDTVGTLARTYYNRNRSEFTDGDICVGNDRSMGPCGGGTFTNGAVCVGSGNRACEYNSTFDHSYCIGNFDNNGNSSCTSYGTPAGTIKFTNHSVCYANARNTCNSSYDQTSCCTGTYCPSEEVTCAYKNITPPPQPTY